MSTSVITLTFNNFDELKATINSIPGSDEIQKVVVNGGKCKDTFGFLDNASDILSISEPDQGIADAFNKGIKLSSGDYLLFLNSGDCLISQKYLDWARQQLDANPQIMFTHADIIFSDPTYGDLHLVPHHKSVGRGMPYFHQTMVFRKSVFDSFGLFSLAFSIAMDYELVCRITRAGLAGLYFSEEPVVRMDGGGVSRMKERLSIKESFRALRKNKLLNNPQIIFDFATRIIAYELRSLLEGLGLKHFVRRLKRFKRLTD
jgi:GT2 family glycosyltransferase